MSGGSYDYKYYTIDEYYVGRMFDVELDEMMADLKDVLHDLEWWQSSDYAEEDYRETVDKFKKKWFKRTRLNVKNLIDKAFEDKKEELYKTLKYISEE